MNNLLKQTNEETKLKKTKFEEGQFVWVSGTGFINEVDSESRTGTVQDFNEDAVQVSFSDGTWDWFTTEQVDSGKNDRSNVGCESKPFFNGFKVL